MKDDLLDAQFSGCRALALAVAGESQSAWCCRLVWVPGDAPALEPIGADRTPAPSERWQVCHDGSDGYDLWYVGSRAKMALVKTGLSLEEAAALFKPMEERL